MKLLLLCYLRFINVNYIRIHCNKFLEFTIKNNQEPDLLKNRSIKFFEYQRNDFLDV